MSDLPPEPSNPDALAAILRHTNIALLLLTPQGVITSAEGAALDRLADPQISGRRLADLVDQPEAADAIVARALAGQAATGRLRLTTGASSFVIDSGSAESEIAKTQPASGRWWDVECSAIPGGLRLIANDISEAYETRLSLDEVLTGVRGILWHADVTHEEGRLRWNFKVVNEAMGPQLVPLTLLPGQTWGQVWLSNRHPDDMPRMNRISSEALLSGAETYRQTFRCISSDGQVHWLREEVQIKPAGPDRWRLVGICTEITELRAQEQRLNEFELLVDNALDAVLIFDTGGNIRYANPAASGLLGYQTHGALIGLNINSLLDTAEQRRVIEEIIPQLASGWRGEVTFQRSDGSAWPTQTSAFQMTDLHGTIYGTAALISDISAQRQAENERRALQEALIETQQTALRELSTPLIPLADGVVAMPLVGAIDGARAQQVMETLLEGIAALQAELAILDVTGVKMVDTQVADSLLRVARAASLLGAHVVLTGISAEVAQSLVQLGADLRGVTTLTNLQAGIAYALERQAAEKTHVTREGP